MCARAMRRHLKIGRIELAKIARYALLQLCERVASDLRRYSTNCSRRICLKLAHDTFASEDMAD